ncbi:MAG: hypothetical protein IPM53_21085 [Anaerolineaceae bacterium]|nr:hypothetical protein [Anaerolineaceae bacterium]
MQDDYIEEEYVEEESSSNRRPFLVAVGVLVTLFILMGACTAFFLVNNRAAEEQAQERAAIETRNAETLAANAATAIAATEAAAVIQPTNTVPPTVASTNTPAPPTPTPSNTPVVDAGEAEGDLTETPEGGVAEGTVIAEGEIVVDGTAVAEADATAAASEEGGATAGATATPITAVIGTDDGTGDALPQTGLDTWSVLVVAFVLVGLVFFARRLRTSG